MLKALLILLTLISFEASAGGGLGSINGIAINDATAPVYQNTGGIGDYLIAPLYVSNAGWSAELKIINTSTVYSTVAKVIIHERSGAKEMLEFLVFLSPGDVWKGTIACNADGVNTCASLGVTSRDTDSLPQYAADANGRITISGKVAGGDIGYINVVESAAWVLGAAPVNKIAIVAQHNADLRAAGFSQGFVNAVAIKSNPPFAAKAMTGATVLGVTGYAEVRTQTVAAAENILAGNLRLTNALNNASATQPLVAIANYRNARPLSESVFTGIGSDEPANTSPCYTTLGALELALNNNDWLVPYDHAEGMTLASVTFPTRQTFDGILHGGSATGVSNKISPGIYSFNNKSAEPIFAYTTIRDEQENYISYSCFEYPFPCRAVYRPTISVTGFFLMSLGNNTTDNAGFLNIVGTDTFQAGWMRVNIDRQTGAPNAYPGAPAIVTAMQWSSLGNNLRAEWWYPQFKSVTGVNSND